MSVLAVFGVFAIALVVVRKRADRWAVLAVVAALIAIVPAVAQTVMTANSGSDKEQTAQPTPTTAIPTSTPAVAPAPPTKSTPEAGRCKTGKPKMAGELGVCPVTINGGRKLKGPTLELAGQFTGPASERENLRLFVKIDPDTRDTCGKKGGPGHFPVTNARLNSEPDGSWTYNDDFGNYLQGVTFGRLFEIARVPPATWQKIISQRDEWEQVGMSSLPEGVKVLHTFEAEPGEPDDSTAC